MSVTVLAVIILVTLYLNSRKATATPTITVTMFDADDLSNKLKQVVQYTVPDVGQEIKIKGQLWIVERQTVGTVPNGLSVCLFLSKVN